MMPSNHGQYAGVTASSVLQRSEFHDDRQVIAAVEEYLSLLAVGEPPALDEFVSAHPEIADPLRECLAGLELVRQAAPDVAASEASLIQLAAATAMPTEPLGDYRLVREIGRGGMGIVYEAEQLSLGRRVALKTLPLAAVLDPRQLQRFKNEALAAAHLDHPNIVEVYGVGCERGIHFYAMRFVEGVTLAELIEARRAQAQGTPRVDQPSSKRSAGRPLGPERDADSQGTPGEVDRERNVTSGRSLGLDNSLQPAASSLQPASHSSFAAETARAFLDTTARHQPDFFRLVAQLGIQAAEALDHAHRTGVIHRDIKPSNLMLDASGKVWITDFGLARIGADTPLTMTGDMLGTLRYMSPEQAAGWPTMIDHRTDIYSLGATLYELATCQPVVQGDDRAAILRAIADAEPTPPREVARSLPIDLETILLKCLAKEPAARYESAQALADDLRRFLEQKPVVAKRPNLLQRLGHWSQRHARLLSVAAAAAVITGLVGGALVWQERNEALEQRQLAEARLRTAAEKQVVAFNAVGHMMVDIADNRLLNQPGMEPLRRELLEAGVQFYEQSLATDAAELQLPDGTAASHYELAMLYAGLGDRSQADGHFQEALQLLTNLVDSSAPEAGRHDLLARAHHNFAGFLLEEQRFEDAADHYRAALKLRQGLVEVWPDVAQHQLELAVAHYNLGMTLVELQQTDVASDHYDRAAALLSRLMEESPHNSNVLGSYARVLTLQALLHRQSGRLNDAENASREAVSIRRHLVEDSGSRADARTALVGDLSTWGQVLTERKRYAEASAALQEAVELGRALTRDFPEAADSREELARALANLGACHYALEQPAEAEASYRAAVQQCAWLDERHPETPRYRSFKAIYLGQLAGQLVRQQRAAEAEVAYRQCLDILAPLARAYPAVRDYRESLRERTEELAQLLHGDNRHAEAERLLSDNMRPGN